MLNFKGKRVYLACGATDMRKSTNGLMTIVQESFKLDPFDTDIYVFCSRDRTRVKILEWDTDGFWLYYKRLEKGHFKWPQLGGAPTMAMNENELSILLGSAKIELKLKRNEVLERKIS